MSRKRERVDYHLDSGNVSALIFAGGVFRQAALAGFLRKRVGN